MSIVILLKGRSLPFGTNFSAHSKRVRTRLLHTVWRTLANQDVTIKHKYLDTYVGGSVFIEQGIITSFAQPLQYVVRFFMSVSRHHAHPFASESMSTQKHGNMAFTGLAKTEKTFDCLSTGFVTSRSKRQLARGLCYKREFAKTWCVFVGDRTEPWNRPEDERGLGDKGTVVTSITSCLLNIDCDRDMSRPCRQLSAHAPWWLGNCQTPNFDSVSSQASVYLGSCILCSVHRLFIGDQQTPWSRTSEPDLWFPTSLCRW